jgi:hypothetical protein
VGGISWTAGSGEVVSEFIDNRRQVKDDEVGTRRLSVRSAVTASPVGRNVVAVKQSKAYAAPEVSVSRT